MRLLSLALALSPSSPLRIGGGTRLKIFESMAAQVPNRFDPGRRRRIAVKLRPRLSRRRLTDLATRCLEMLADADLRRRIASTAWNLVSEHFSWKHAARCFEQILIDS